jgi:hypothetical protein
MKEKIIVPTLIVFLAVSCGKNESSTSHSTTEKVFSTDINLIEKREQVQENHIGYNLLKGTRWVLKKVVSDKNEEQKYTKITKIIFSQDDANRNITLKDERITVMTGDKCNGNNYNLYNTQISNVYLIANPCSDPSINFYEITNKRFGYIKIENNNITEFKRESYHDNYTEIYEKDDTVN